jgi:hypothetical protein
MTDPVMELIKLENGDIALRNSDAPEEVLLTISFSDQLQGFLQSDQLEIARAMVVAGMDRYRDIQIERMEEAKQVSETGVLH